MPALNFKKEFASKVKSGKKNQTIRLVRIHPIKVGDWLYLFTGMRTKNCRLLRKVLCRGTVQVEITERNILIPEWSRTPMNHVARRDGFAGVDDLIDFFRKQYGLPFEGVLIWWNG